MVWWGVCGGVKVGLVKKKEQKNKELHQVVLNDLFKSFFWFFLGQNLNKSILETKSKVVEVRGGRSDAIITRGYNTNKLNRLVTQGQNPFVNLVRTCGQAWMLSSARKFVC